MRGAEELSNRCGHRLRIDQVPRHRRLHLLMDRHLLFDCAFHADQSDAKLILEELAHRSHTSIAEVIDVVGFANTFAHLEDIGDHIDEIPS